MSNPLLNEALSYAKRGWAVIPVYGIRPDGTCACGKYDCQNSGKHPRAKNGSKDATKEESEIWRFCQFPHTNIGIATGAVSGILVLDIDPRHGGDESLQQLETQYGPLPKTITALTGNPGGEHRYFRYPSGREWKNRANLRPGLDVRGDGGYVVAPPSTHYTGNRYAWEMSSHSGETELAEAPEWLLRLMAGADAHRSENEHSQHWNEGSRNTNLFRLAASFRGRGMSVEATEAALLAENKSRCHPPLQDSEVKKIADSASRYEPGAKPAHMTWEERKEIPATTMEVPELPENLIPAPLKDWAKDVVERMQTSLEMLMAPFLVILGGLIGRRLGVRPKQKDTWTIIPNLWGGLVAPPSAMKSPIMKAVLYFIYQLDKIAKADFDEAMLEYEKLKEEYDKQQADGAEGLDKPTKPIRKFYLVNDSTTEKLGILLSENPNGLIVFRDELMGLFTGMDKPGREGDRQFYLEAYNGDSPYSYHRVIRGTIEIPALCLSILGGIQPDLLSTYFEAALKNGSSGDGFFPRFQVLVYPPKRPEWELVDRYPNAEAIERVFSIFRKIDEMDFIGHGFEQDDDLRPFVRFDDLAQELFYAWLTKLEKRLRSGEIESPAFEAHITKYKKLMPSLALIFHLVEICDPQRRGDITTKIGINSARMAAAWCDFLEKHADKIYADSRRVTLTAVHALAKKIQSGEITDRMTVRNLYRKEWSMLRNPKIVRSALTELEALGWLKVLEESATGKGAPSEVIHLHPDFLDGGIK